MDTNKLLRDNGINDPAAFGFAAELARQGKTGEEIITAVISEFQIRQKIQVNNSTLPYKIYGEPGVDIAYNAIEQMDEVMKLPPALKGALMPDAHHGYAMPIGGVVGMLNAVSPSFVGYDIACRMAVSILDLPVDSFIINKQEILKVMQNVTRFGLGSEFEDPREHEVMDDPLWTTLPHLAKVRDKAQRQLGSSGGGNHFFDALIGEAVVSTPHLVNSKGEQYQKGQQFVTIMTHSGSRGVGHNMATFYLKLAETETRSQFTGIPKGYEWLNMSGRAGQEYWEVMQLMGRYARANHELIHNHFIKEAGISTTSQFENHHNFAWMQDGMFVHRKGATPASVGEIGIIPGSSGTPSYIVEGLGNLNSLRSSSHGAGRPFSRKEAKQRHVQEQYEEHMDDLHILTSGVSPDETFMAYKDIERVIALQEGILVRVIAKMWPEIVIMGGR